MRLAGISRPVGKRGSVSVEKLNPHPRQVQLKSSIGGAQIDEYWNNIVLGMAQPPEQSQRGKGNRCWSLVLAPDADFGGLLMPRSGALLSPMT